MKLKVERITETDLKRWNDLFLKAKYPHYLVSIPFEYTKEIIQRKSETYIFHSGEGNDIAGIHYSFKASKFGFFTIADITSGIVFRSEADIDVFRFIIKHFLEWSKQKKASFVRINPWIPLIQGGTSNQYQKDFSQALIEFGFSDLKIGRHTYWIDLTKSKEELKKKMNPQTRKRIRLAEEAGLEVDYEESYSEDTMRKFYELYHKLGDQKNFETLSEIRFFAETKALFETGATLFIIKFKGIIINMALATRFGISSYFHGALNSDYKKIDGCPSPGHYMQWCMIKYMKEKGLSTFDMAYCPGPVPIPDHPRFDMWRFKFGFGGEHVEYMPLSGKILHPLRGRIFRFLMYKK